ncbi:hypothetical protein ACHAXT_005173 [Thalassiosira profunda]
MNDYTLNFSSAAPSPAADETTILFPGQSTVPAAKTESRRDDGVVISPDPAIVIKTRLLKEQQGNFSFDDAASSYIPPSLSGLCSDPGSNAGDSNAAKDAETKVFLNVCTHPLVAAPGKRKGLDDETGKEVDGWRLPMSIGEPRPAYDKGGNPAIAADCVLNPSVVRDMRSDPNHFQFVCDLIVQCATRKFAQSFGGFALDRRFKVPKMKYAGYVDEATGLPAIIPQSARSTDGPGGDVEQKAVVAKQRIKGHAKAIIEEVERSPSEPVSEVSSVAAEPRRLVTPQAKVDAAKSESRVELFVDDGGDPIPLLDFLSLAAEQDGIASPDRPSAALRELVRSPKLKPACESNRQLHPSQLLTTPLPLDVTAIRALSGTGGADEEGNDNGSEKPGCWSIVAKCSRIANSPSSPTSVPSVELSALLLVLSSDDARTECVLPFPVDTHQTTASYNPTNGALELRMPLLQGDEHCMDAGPDPGTRQNAFQNAFGGGKGGVATASEKESSLDAVAEDGSLANDAFGSYFVNTEVGGDGIEGDDDRPLPEDAFHAQDAMSRHLLQQQEDERAQRAAKSDRGREGAAVEYIDIESFRKTPMPEAHRGESVDAPMIKQARAVMKNSLHDISAIGGDLVTGLV